MSRINSKPASADELARYHRDGLLINDIIDPNEIDTADAPDVQLSAGQISLHDAHTVHASQSNKSSARRDRTGRNDFTIGHDIG